MFPEYKVGKSDPKREVHCSFSITTTYGALLYKGTTSDHMKKSSNLTHPDTCIIRTTQPEALPDRARPDIPQTNGYHAKNFKETTSLFGREARSSS